MDVVQAQLREVEAELGRVRGEDKYAPRTIDLDLLGLADTRAPSSRLSDPEIAERAHLAIPLAELLPEFEYAGTGETLASIAERLNATSTLERHAEVSARLQAIVKRAQTR